MHELRLDKHLKTKEVEMLALATINIISVDEKLENSQNVAALRSGGRRGWGLVAFPLQSGAAASSSVCLYARSPITIPIVLRHTTAHGALHWGPDG